MPEEQFKDYPTPPQTLPRSPGHYMEWIQAKQGQGPGARFERPVFRLGHRVEQLMLLKPT